LSLSILQYHVFTWCLNQEIKLLKAVPELFTMQEVLLKTIMTTLMEVLLSLLLTEIKFNLIYLNLISNLVAVLTAIMIILLFMTVRQFPPLWLMTLIIVIQQEIRVLLQVPVMLLLLDFTVMPDWLCKVSKFNLIVSEARTPQLHIFLRNL